MDTFVPAMRPAHLTSMQHWPRHADCEEAQEEGPDQGGRQGGSTSAGAQEQRHFQVIRCPLLPDHVMHVTQGGVSSFASQEPLRSAHVSACSSATHAAELLTCHVGSLASPERHRSSADLHSFNCNIYRLYAGDISLSYTLLEICQLWRPSKHISSWVPLQAVKLPADQAGALSEPRGAPAQPRGHARLRQRQRDARGAGRPCALPVPAAPGSGCPV